mmetsp:Transcript_124645/g.240583  ORF Transcript_124645/g.240583 Transcript_124645/m.240583 type:complete len:213 (-) Transcript_124645:1330-1968(-)
MAPCHYFWVLASHCRKLICQALSGSFWVVVVCSGTSSVLLHKTHCGKQIRQAFTANAEVLGVVYPISNIFFFNTPLPAKMLKIDGKVSLASLKETLPQPFQDEILREVVGEALQIPGKVRSSRCILWKWVQSIISHFLRIGALEDECVSWHFFLDSKASCEAQTLKTPSQILILPILIQSVPKISLKEICKPSTPVMNVGLAWARYFEGRHQ